MEEKEIGEVIDYFSRVGVIAIKLSSALKIGDTIHIKGHTTDITQEVESMQINNKPVKGAKKGDDIGIKVNDRARKNDKVFLVE